jgi:membrane protease YdiL (CAAX protease family)
MLTFLSFLFLGLSFLSLWVKRDPKIWGSLLGLSIVCGLITGIIHWLGLIFLLILIGAWVLYAKKPNFALFAALTIATIIFHLRLVPGFELVMITSKFKMGLHGPITGLLPLALLVPLSKTANDWKKVLKGLGLGFGGIGIMAILATIAGATHWEMKLPAYMALRAWSNLNLTCMAEEGFYRGFLQTRLIGYFHNTQWGKVAGLLLTSAIFTFDHIFWSPNATILAFVFIASLLYGGVYLLSGKIESAILTHFSLNMIHMIFFNYHAM